MLLTEQKQKPAPLPPPIVPPPPMEGAWQAFGPLAAAVHQPNPAPEPEKNRLKIVGFCLLVGLIALLAAGKVILADTLDPDIFWHIQVGHELAARHWPGPLVDDLSFSSLRAPWTPYSWLAEIGMARLWDIGGYRAVVAAQAGIEAFFLILISLSAIELTRKVHGSAKYLSSALAAALAGFYSLAYLSFRPVTFVLVILSIVAWLILRDRRIYKERLEELADPQAARASKLIWLVPLLTAVGINIHFFAAFAPAFLFAILVGNLFRRNNRNFKRNGILFLLTTAACCATPMIGGMIDAIRHYAAADVMVKSSMIAEMQPFYHGTIGYITAGLIVLTLLLALRGRLNGEYLWLLGCTALTIFAGRMLPVYAIIGAPMLILAIPLSDRILQRKLIIVLLGMVCVAGGARLVMEFPKSSEPISQWLDRNGADAPHYPCAAADYVMANIRPQSHRLICEFSWGGYLEWRTDGQYQTLMDGRTQVFSTDFWNAAYFEGKIARTNLLQNANADAAILPLKGPLAEALLDQPTGWSVVYKDEFAQVLVPNRAR